jgi:hypothetical protein
MNKIISFSICILLLVFSCKTKTLKINRGFYYWKSSYNWINEEEDSIINSNKITKMYVHFFDVIPDKFFEVGKPEYLTNLNLEFDENIEIIPTVYVKNEVLKNKRIGTIDSLANNIVYLINDLLINNNKQKINEIQIDCDWTKTTKENYFNLLKSIKKYSNKQISVTLRLYPFAYPEIMGIPPADRATLMCYNLISPFNNAGKNSILDINELNSYLKRQSSYKIPLDIALPIFQRYHLFRHGRYFKSFSKIYNTPIWNNNKDKWMSCAYSYEDEYNDFYFKTGDILKVEKISENTLYKTIQSLKNSLEFSKEINLILFDLDENQIKNYDKKLFNRYYFHFFN